MAAYPMLHRVGGWHSYTYRVWKWGSWRNSCLRDTDDIVADVVHNFPKKRRGIHAYTPIKAWQWSAIPPLKIETRTENKEHSHHRH